MQLSGVLQISVPPARVAQALERPDVLRQLLPGEASVERQSAGLYSFTMRKSLGFLELRQGGTIQLEPTGQGVTLVIRAANRIGGAADVSVLIGLARRNAGTEIAYDGTMEATGLAGRLLRDREAQVRPYIAKVFGRMKAQIEGPSRG